MALNPVVAINFSALPENKKNAVLKKKPDPTRPVYIHQINYSVRQIDNANPGTPYYGIAEDLLIRLGYMMVLGRIK